MKLPSGISSHIIPRVNGFDMHLFEAGDWEAPAIILLHGYPELAYSWRKSHEILRSKGICHPVRRVREILYMSFQPFVPRSEPIPRFAAIFACNDSIVRLWFRCSFARSEYCFSSPINCRC